MTAMLTAAEVAGRLREKRQTTIRRLRRGEIRGFKVGRQWLVEEADVQRFLDANVNFVSTDQRRRRR
jgi:excisionase family DNA binding protein